MKLPWQKTTWENSIRANVALAFSNAVLALIAIIAVIHSFSVKSDVVLTPPRVDEEMRIGFDSANEAYVKSFGLYAAQLISNITAANANFVVEAMSSFMDSSVYAETRKTILSTVDTRLFKEAAGATKYEPTNIVYEPSTRKVFVIGNMTTLSSIGPGSATSMVYEMEIRIVERRPVIYSLTSYPGSVPHTQEWLKDHKVQEENQ